MTKKTILFSALASVSACVAVPLVAQALDTPPTFTVSGFGRFQAYSAHNSKTTEPGVTDPTSKPSFDQGPGYAYGQNTEVSFGAAGATDGGTDYSFSVTVDGGAGINGSSAAINEAYMSFSNDKGTVTLGNTDTASTMLNVGPLNVLGATGGYGGDYKNAFVIPAGVFAGTNMVGMSDGGTAVSYYTPRIAGFMAGITTTPNSALKGKTVTHTGTASTPRTTNNFEFAVNYARAWQDFGLSLSLANVLGRSRTANNLSYGKTRDVNAWNAGALFTYGRWMLGFSYINNGTSAVPDVLANAGANAGKAYNTAVGYNFGDYKVAAGYQRTNTNVARGATKATADVVSLTTDYTIAPGLGVYAEADYAKMKNNATAVAWSNSSGASPNGTAGKGSNEGATLIAGVKIMF